MDRKQKWKTIQEDNEERRRKLWTVYRGKNSKAPLKRLDNNKNLRFEAGDLTRDVLHKSYYSINSTRTWDGYCNCVWRNRNRDGCLAGRTCPKRLILTANEHRRYLEENLLSPFHRLSDAFIGDTVQGAVAIHPYRWLRCKPGRGEET
jgi:hypothetical protein